MHTRNELITYSREDLEKIAVFAAKTRLIGSIYIGAMGEPQTRWKDDGSLEVIIPHTPTNRG